MQLRNNCHLDISAIMFNLFTLCDMFEEIIQRLDIFEITLTCHSVAICLLNISFWLYVILHNHNH